jgi:hypothetical protein
MDPMNVLILLLAAGVCVGFVLLSLARRGR